MAGRGDGVVCVTVGHCTCALYLNENEAGLVADTLDLVREGRLVGKVLYLYDPDGNILELFEKLDG